VKVLADTQVFLWAVQQPALLGPRFRRVLEDPASEIWLSVISPWEARIKHDAGKLALKSSLDELARDFVQDEGRILNVRLAHAAHRLPDPPTTKDPFDRLLLAQCDVEGMRLLTSDQALAGHRLAVTVGRVPTRGVAGP
jgi:PIN domain nuclease of toxin-antitoxin system